MPGRLKKDECRAGDYRKSAFITMLLTGGVCLFFLLVSPFLGRAGTGKAELDEHIVIAAIVFFTFLVPCLTLLGVYASIRGWDRWKEEKLKKWMAALALCVIRITCLITTVSLIGFIFFLDYEAPRDKGGLPPADPRPYKRSLSYHANYLFFFANIGLVFITSMGLLIPNPDDDTNAPEKSTASDDDG
jgi:amino acid transporter